MTTTTVTTNRLANMTAAVGNGVAARLFRLGGDATSELDRLSEPRMEA